MFDQWEVCVTYRFHQLINATLSPHKALEAREPSAAMIAGIHMEAAVATKLDFSPWLPEGVTFGEEEMNQYDTQANRVVDILKEEPFTGLVYQPALAWPWAKGRSPWEGEPDAREPLAEGHPDFCEFLDDHIVDLKTTEYPTEEKLKMYLYSIQMACYMAAYLRMYERPPKLSIILASRLVQPDPVKFNKDGTVSLSGQNAEHYALKEAVELMGSKADDRHWTLVYKAPVWNPVMVGTLEKEECAELAKVGSIFLNAGLEILDTGLAEMVVRPYA
jgi:hypothetical protein